MAFMYIIESEDKGKFLEKWCYLNQRLVKLQKGTHEWKLLIRMGVGREKWHNDINEDRVTGNIQGVSRFD